MQQVVTLREFKQDSRLIQVMVRIPRHIREQALSVAEKESSDARKVTETDVYRTAILLFLSSLTTDSSEGIADT